jgi:transposase
MWTLENRAKYNCDHLRYPSDLTDDEWAHVEPLIPPAKPGGGKRRTDMRAVMDGVMYILSTGWQWRYLPKDFPSYSTVHRYFVWWQCDGVLDRRRRVPALSGPALSRPASLSADLNPI